MRSFLFVILLLAGFAVPASAQDARYGVPPVVGPHPPVWRFNGPPQEMPFMRGERAQAVWNSGACWSECGSYCAWAMNECAYRDTQGTCLAYSNSCDLICQRACRTGAGPWLPID